jgi:hypothetical protein
MTGPLGAGRRSEAKIRDFLEFLLRNSPPCQRVAELGTSRDSYASCPGGGGAGRGEPLTVAAEKLKPGGGGAGRGEPLAAEKLKPGGGGAGRGEPLTAEKLKPGGGGAGRGEPLAAEKLKPGGGGAGSGEPLRNETETTAARLLDKCLTEL